MSSACTAGAYPERPAWRFESSFVFVVQKRLRGPLKAALTSDVGLAMRPVVIHLKAPRLLEDHQSRNSNRIEQLVQVSPRRRTVCRDILGHHA